MQRTPVTSSQLVSLGWEPAGDAALGVLEVEFVRGLVYRYEGVPRSVHAALLTEAANVRDGVPAQASVGRLFDRLVKQGGYRHARVAPPA